jgi:tetratricopeptide (TPR) repeat protein
LPLQARGEFALVTQTLEAALERAGQPVKRGTMAHEHEVHMLLTEAAVQQRDAARLPEHAARLEALAERDDHALYRAIAHRAWGVALRLRGEHAAAQSRLQQALDLFAAQGTRWQAGRTRLELAETAAALGDLALARRHGAEAQADFAALGAQADLERARQLLAALGRNGAAQAA